MLFAAFHTRNSLQISNPDLLICFKGSKMKISILGTQVTCTDYQKATAQILRWAQAKESRVVCATSVHGVIEAHDHPEFQEKLNNADMITSDGMPLVWTMRLKGIRDQQRVYGPDLMLAVLEAAKNEGLVVGFLGSTKEVLEKLTLNMKARFPGLMVGATISPPFRKLSPKEDQEIIHQVNRSGIQVLFVGLGCPKQEIWMAEHRGKVRAVMVGVGAAFDFHAGMIRQAPSWMQKMGLEWLFRLIQEPKRLWRRYLYNNPRFVFYIIGELINEKLNNNKRSRG
jgi:N-acetylglucosaminyldiphosphoundecaprenol N-acetyl-beta-D-mannosaminyltransferase